MLLSLSVTGLNNKIDKTLEFHPDLNILTGKNGSGKTTILKVLWYLISGNIERIPREIPFKSIHLKTTDFSIKLSHQEEPAETTKKRDCLLEYTIGNRTEQRALRQREIEEEVTFVRRANQTIVALRPSIFFSTFRRIEGGFGTRSPAEEGMRSRVIVGPGGVPDYVYSSVDLQDPLRALSRILSVRRHKFVASISTEDIVTLLTEEFASISEATNRKHHELTTFIFDVIAQYGSPTSEPEAEQLRGAKQVLERVRQKVELTNRETESLLRPFTTLSRLVDGIFSGRSIGITDAIVLGSGPSKVKSYLLSSGEKQILSFLCYNAFSSEIPIFIDEPELSLHVDWQRLLFSTLLSQGTHNQFITATHSPFIYALYKEKELPLDDDRGGF